MIKKNSKEIVIARKNTNEGMIKIFPWSLQIILWYKMHLFVLII